MNYITPCRDLGWMDGAREGRTHQCPSPASQVLSPIKYRRLELQRGRFVLYPEILDQIYCCRRRRGVGDVISHEITWAGQWFQSAVSTLQHTALRLWQYSNHQLASRYFLPDSSDIWYRQSRICLVIPSFRSHGTSIV